MFLAFMSTLRGVTRLSTYVFKRILSMLPIFIGITLISFVIVHLAPGDPMAVMMNPKLKPSDIERITANLGLNQPLYVQYFKWFTSLLRFDFGNSFISGQPVIEILKPKIPVTILLCATGMFVAIFIAVILGILSATKQYSKADYTVSVLAFAGLSIPTFWFSLMLILVFGVYLKWLPTAGMYNLRAETITLGDRIAHMILPVIAFAAPSIASWTRYMRSSMLEVIREDYIRTARSKGLKESIVIYKHALRNALIPMVTLLGLSMAFLISGAFVIESMFGWPGMGRTGIDAIFQRNYPVVMAINTLTAVLVLVFNLLTDLTYAFIDPRIKYN